MRARSLRLRAARCPARVGNLTRGFTLVEMMIVIAIVGLMLAVGTYTLRNLTRANLREAAGSTSAAMRYAFDRSLMTGMYLRLAIDLEKGQLWLEASKDRVSLRQGREQHATDGKDEDEDESEDEAEAPTGPKLPFGLGGGGEEGADEAPFDVKALIRGYEKQIKPIKPRKARFNKLRAIGAKTIRLKGKIFVDAVMTPRHEEPVEKGMSYIYFFPQGHAEPAIIHLKNTANEYYSVVMHPLTGQARIYNCRYRLPKEFGQDDLERRKKDVCDDPPRG
ncbi:MAG: hypothetical protein CSA65_07555 [Proteobacteria bacterium]|nr:MAG: hypothetical protein CSB49_01570 [Pseudomonadota bacterium]PIE17748.1 MAG: hypothetical protein CSA65_07555 [Pseudomonadota bacterium]